MTDPEPNQENNFKNRLIYRSPSYSRSPIRRALRSSNNNVGVFLGKLEALNKMNEHMKKLSLNNDSKEEKENKRE